MGRTLEPVFDHLVYMTAQSAVVFNDDTKMRVAALRKEIRAEAEPKRTVIVSQAENHPFALFFTGLAHARENPAEVLAHLEPHRSPPLHMTS